MKSTDGTTVERLRAELRHLATLGPDQARTMPPEFYTDRAFLEFEQEHLLRNQWMCVGHDGEIPGPGDYFTTELLDEPLIVVRDLDGQIRVLSNVCRHRANLVAQGKGTAKRFICPYHTWTYRTDGSLLRAPLMEDVAGFDPASCALPRFASEVWNRFVFVNLDGEAPPLGPRLAGLSETLRNYHHEDRTFVYGAEDVWGTNWKCLIENFIEGYHLSSTHRTTLHPTTPTKLCRKLPGSEDYTAYRSYYDPSVPERGPYHADLTEDEKRNSVMGAVFPCLLFGIATHFSIWMALRPAGVDRVAIRWGVAGFLENPEDPKVQSFVELCHAFNAEDREKLETQWTGLQSRSYRSGRLAPPDYEGTIWDFLQHVAIRLGTPTRAEPA